VVKRTVIGIDVCSELCKSYHWSANWLRKLNGRSALTVGFSD
jgi:hypothetical protein